MQEKIEVLSGSKINNLERMKNSVWTNHAILLKLQHLLQKVLEDSYR